MTRTMRAADIQVGDHIRHESYEGEVVERVDHYRSLGDGTEDWVTFIVEEDGKGWSDPCGPLRASTEIQRLTSGPLPQTCPSLFYDRKAGPRRKTGEDVDRLRDFARWAVDTRNDEGIPARYEEISDRAEAALGEAGTDPAESNLRAV